MRPGYLSVITEIVRIGNLAALDLFRFLDPEGEPLLPGIGDRLLPRVEDQADLALHVAGGRVAHQRIDLLGLLGIEFQHPAAGLGLARLHGGSGWTVDEG